MKKSFLLVIAIILVNFIFAQTSNMSNQDYYVSSEKAQTIGVNFHAHQANKLNPEKYGNVNYAIKNQTTLKTVNGLDCIHVYNFNEGFVLVSADVRTTPVLAYSNEGEFNYDNMAPATKSWIEENYMPQYDYINEMNIAVNQDILNQWDKISKNDFSDDKNDKGVDFLLTTRWNQDFPYNMYCPLHTQGPNGRVYAGCVATAMSQVMKYWSYPETGKGSMTYFWGDYITVDFDTTYYNWDKMTAVATSVNRREIAQLMYQCAVSVNMNWGHDGSGTQTGYVVNAMKQHFKYRTGIYYLYQDTLTDAVWRYTLKEDLDKGQPIIYSAQPESGPGHAFVCDGYQDTAYFHFNWGWGGASDGYFFIGHLNPIDNVFNYGHAAALNITPNYSEYCTGTITYTQPEWTFDDGSGNSYYYNNTLCNWIISPDVEDLELIRLTFNRFDLADNDVLKIYKAAAPNAALELVGEYTSTNRPPYMIDNWGGDKFYIVFETNEEGQAEGWEIQYTTYTTNIEVNKLSNINIYPNPAQNTINITGIIDSNVAIYDIYGKLIKEFNNINNTTIDISDMSNGVYFININNADGVKTMKFVKN